MDKPVTDILDDPINDIQLNKIEKKERIARGPFQPQLLLFPRRKIGNKIRSFQISWYGKYKWIEYSQSTDAAFCFYCRFFSVHNSSSVTSHPDPAFIKTGYKNWNKANECFRSHEKSRCHLASTSAWSAYSKNKPIDIAIDEGKQLLLTQKEEERKRNRSVMERLIKIIITLVKGGHYLRGHNEKQENTNRGQFLELVNFVAKYDVILKEHIDNGPKNATYLSKDSQNALFFAIRKVILRNTAIILKNKKISIIDDETSDCGHHEQMAIVIRYFDETINRPREMFIDLKRLLNTDAKSIFDKLDQFINYMNLDWSSIVFVCFDGAATMSGSVSGVQSLCKEKNNNILYVHCYAHCLNLVLVHACSTRNISPVIFNFFGTIQCIYNLIEGSCTRHAILEKVAARVGIALKTLKSLSNTRWSCRSEAVSAVKNNYSAILLAIEEIVNTTKMSDVSANGRGLLYQLKSFHFIFALEMIHPILQMIVKVSNTLQSSEINLMAALNIIKSLRLSLLDMRNAEALREIYSKTVVLCEQNGIEIPPVKKRKISVRIDNNSNSQHFPTTPEEEMKITCYYHFLDKLMTELDQRFQQETLNIIDAVGKLLNLEENENLKVVTAKFNVSSDDLYTEIRLLKSEESKPKGSSTSTLWEWLDWLNECGRKQIYSSFYKIIEIFSVIPVSSCSPERVFSKLCHVKQKLRSTMSQELLESLLFLYVEQDSTVFVNIDDVIDEFKNSVSFDRRLTL